MNNTILEYISNERKRGVSDDAIRVALLASGWKEEDVIAAFAGEVQAVADRVLPAFSFGYVKYLYTGRVGRFYYFEGSLILFFLYLALLFVLTEAYLLATGMSGFMEFIDAHKTFFQFSYLPFFVVQYSLLVRRLHDLDHSGWWGLCTLIPVASFVLGVYILFFKGTEGSNSFGAPSEYSKSTSWAWKAIWKI